MILQDSNFLRQLFGDNRAEWPSEDFDELFVKPSYSSKLESLKPCILVGGRGTGKTTALQSLKFDVSLDRYKRRGDSFSDMPYLGVFLRINKNQVNAFQGGGRSEEQWNKIFAHYFNLMIAYQMVELCTWVEDETGSSISSDDLNIIGIDLALNKCKNLVQLSASIRESISTLQIHINSLKCQEEILLSVAEYPLRTITEALIKSLDQDEKTIFCCIDEYENLLPYQQAIVNTYIKHASPPLSYKVGVRKYGIKNYQTLDGGDLLKTPDDFSEIEISEEGFPSFAVEVAEKRLSLAIRKGIEVPAKLSEFLRELSFNEELELLGASKVTSTVLSELELDCPDIYQELKKQESTNLYFLQYWAEQESKKLCVIAKEYLSSETKWKTRFGNYKYASLFWLTAGRKGTRIRKFYAGQQTYLALASGNIRFFLELIDQAISIELSERVDETKIANLSLSPKAQTIAAKKVGERRLDQLEGLADNGVQLKRLVLAVGKVFFEFAKSPIGKTPEITSFLINGEEDAVKQIKKLLRDGVGHLAIEASPRTKATSNSELRDEEFRLHPIFCAFFEMSHRKKRRTTFNAEDMLRSTETNPSASIRKMMGGTEHTDIEDLPAQLALFSPFYGGNSSIAGQNGN